jgi:hypothetical protein
MKIAMATAARTAMTIPAIAPPEIDEAALGAADGTDEGCPDG